MKKELIDLIPILENIPDGRELYCSMFGNVTLSICLERKDYPIRARSVENIELDGEFSKFGNWWETFGECLLWPSKDCRDWKDWARHLVKSGDYVVIKNGNTVSDVDYIFKSEDDVSIVEVNEKVLEHPEIISRWASKEEIATIGNYFKPFKMADDIEQTIGRCAFVIARINGGCWELTNFAYYDAKDNSPFICLCNQHFDEVVPLAGNENILGTRNKPNKRFNFPEL